MKLLKTIVLGFIAVLALSACSSEESFNSFDPEAQFELDKKAIKDLVAKSYPNAKEDTSGSGIWYELLDTATSAPFTYKANASDKSLIFPVVTTNYKLTLLDSKAIDENSKPEGFESPLRSLIAAWHVAFFPAKIGGEKVGGLTEKGLQVGDRIRIFTPSAYAYGNRNQGNIPANSPLIFEIKVLKIVD